MPHALCRLLSALLFALAANAAVVQGVVLDDETGYPLARAQVNLLPIAGTGGAAVALRSGDRGSFTVLSVQPGWYVLRITRVGYAPAEAGQLRAGRPGTPFEVTAEDRASFFQIRMRRLPATTGTVLDENNIGVADFPVHLYTARKPVRRVAETRTDDRGNFRFGALDPGSYIVRTGAAILEDDYSLVPTYFKYGTAVDTSEPIRLHVGDTQPDVNIHPVRGRLLNISGVFSVPADASGRLVLVTDTGRRIIATASGPYNTTVPFEASAIPPGPIELIAEGQGCGAYFRRSIDNNTEGIRMSCANLQRARYEWMVDDRYAGLRYPLMMRRVDLDGVGPVKTMKDSDLIAPGHWEVMAQTGASHYVSTIQSNGAPQPILSEDGWFGLDVAAYPSFSIRLSSKPASVSGSVTTGGKAVAGAVVYLEAFDPRKQNQRIRLWSTRTDIQGGYSFAGLRPGSYRVLSTFDFDPDDPFAMQRASEVTLRDGDQTTQSVELLLP